SFTPYHHSYHFIDISFFNGDTRVILQVILFLVCQAAISIALFFSPEDISLIQPCILVSVYFQKSIIAEKYICIFMKDNLSLMDHIKVIAQGFQITGYVGAYKDRPLLVSLH